MYQRSTIERFAIALAATIVLTSASDASARTPRAARRASVAASPQRASSAATDERQLCAALGEQVRCASARTVSGLTAGAHLLPNVLTREIATELVAHSNGESALVSEVIRRVQAMPYARGTVTPATIAQLALANGAAAMDCDERSFVAAAVINALDDTRRVVELQGGARVAVRRAAVVNVPRIRHAVLLLEVAERPQGYHGPIALVAGAMFLPVECTATLPVGVFDAERDAVLRDPAAETVVTRVERDRVIDVPVRGPFRGNIARPSHSAEGFRVAEAG